MAAFCGSHSFIFFEHFQVCVANNWMSRWLVVQNSYFCNQQCGSTSELGFFSSKRSLWNSKWRTKLVWSFQNFCKRLNISYLILTEIISTAWFRPPKFDNGLKSVKILVQPWPHHHTLFDMPPSNRKLSTNWPTYHRCAKLHH